MRRTPSGFVIAVACVAAAVALLIQTPHGLWVWAHVVNSVNGYAGGDVRGYGAKCDGTTDDTAVFSAAMSTESAAGGGRAVAPKGKTCLFDGASFAEIKTNVELYCEPGATIKAGSSFSGTYLISYSLSGGNQGVVGCKFDLNGKAAGAVKVRGGTNGGAWLINNRVSGGPTSASAYTLLELVGNGAAAPFDVRGNQCTCANNTAAPDTCIAVGGATAGTSVEVTGNSFLNCAGNGITGGTGNANVERNTGNVIGASSIAIDMTGGDGSTARGNKVTTSGSSATGIKTDGARAVVADNTAIGTGASAVCVLSTGTATSITSNKCVNDGTTSIGFDVKGGYSAITGNTGFVTAGAGSQYHLRRGGDAIELTITGNVFQNGAWAVAPTQTLADFGTGPINATMTGNEFYGQSDCAVVATTGDRIVGNRIVWGTSTAHPLCIGDDRTIGGLEIGHIQVVGNLFHCGDCTPLVQLAAKGKRCDASATTKDYQACSSDTNCDSVASACDPVSIKNIVISGNGYLTGPGSTTQIALSLGSNYDADSSTTSGFLVGNNQFGFDSTNDKCLQMAPFAQSSKITGVDLGINNCYPGSTYKTDWVAGMGTDWMAQAVAAPSSVGVGSSPLGTATDYYITFNGFNAATATEGDVAIYPGYAMTVSAMCCSYPGGWTSTNKRTITLRKTGADTELACDLTSSVSKCCDTAGTPIELTAGTDSIDYLAHETGSVTAATVSCWAGYTVTP